MLAFSNNEIIETAIQIEQSGYQYYDQALSRGNLSEKSRCVLTQLRDEERTHEALFESLRTAFDRASLYAAKDWDIVQDYIRSHAESHVFHQPGSAIKMAQKARDEVEIIRYAIGFEKDTILYFTSIHKDMIDVETRSTVKRIVEEEANHVLKLRAILSDLAPGALSQ